MGNALCQVFVPLTLACMQAKANGSSQTMVSEQQVLNQTSIASWSEMRGICIVVPDPTR